MNATMHHNISDVSGVILAGGRSTRFGSNKAFARFRGLTMLSRICRVMVRIFPEVLLITNTPESYSDLNPVKVLSDEIPYQGPMGGLCTAMGAARYDRILVCACDMPLIRESAIQEIVRAGREHEAVIPVVNGREEYLLALYHKGLLPELEFAVQQNKLALKSFFKNRPGVRWLPMTSDSFFNVNTREHLRELEHLHA